MANPGNVSEELERVRQRTERRVGVDKDRRKAQEPVVVERIGDLVLFWATTGPIASGLSSIVYLTDTKGPRGASLFTRKPMMQAERDEVGFTGAGIPRAADPLSPLESYAVSVNANLDYSWTTAWDAVHLCWKVTVANTTGATRDFVVSGMGV